MNPLRFLHSFGVDRQNAVPQLDQGSWNVFQGFAGIQPDFEGLPGIHPFHHQLGFDEG